jgi:hypothetical protein
MQPHPLIHPKEKGRFDPKTTTDKSHAKNEVDSGSFPHRKRHVPHDAMNHMEEKGNHNNGRNTQSAVAIWQDRVP